MSAKYSIIIPTVGATSLLSNVVGSILKYEQDRSKYEIIIVDDGSDRIVQQWVKDFCDNHSIRCVLKDKNEGFSHTVNSGMKHAVGDVLILLNNDVVLMSPILDILGNVMDSDESIGVVGAKLLYPNHAIQHAGVVRIPNSFSFVHINKNRQRNVPEVNVSKYFIAVTGALFAITRKCYNTVGQLNENYFVACEDVEYCLRVWQNNLKVFYSCKIEAVHVEGETRGNTDASKLKKGPQWFLKEKETNAKFYNDLKSMDLVAIDGMVNKANEILVEQQRAVVPNRLEIGCGYNPQPGYVHLDVRPLPGVDVICDFEKDKLPFPDGHFDEVLSNHVIEHISWRKLPFVLSEWFRALKVGGRVFLRTPDLEFICRTYLDRKTTPEWPGDEQFIKENLSDEVTPAWWANIKLFAGQDYDSNFHFLCFDFEMIKSLLEKYGFERVTRLSVLPVYSPGELQIEAFKKDVNKTVQAAKRKNRIVVKRSGALGDVILTTPIIKKLRVDHGQDAIINVVTDCGAVYANNPYVNEVLPAKTSLVGYDYAYDLDFVYERSPRMHIIDAYSNFVFGHNDYDKSTDIIFSQSDKDTVDQLLAKRGVDVNSMVIVHMAVTWRNRTWPKEYWAKAVERITEDGKTVVIVGSGGDISVQADRVVNLTKILTIQQIAYLVSMSKCFVGNDSGLMHIAGSTKTPIVGLYTSAKGEYRVPFRNGEYGYKAKVLKPSVDCYGCLAMEKPPVVFCDCKRGDVICLSQITAEMVSEAVKDVCMD